MALNILSNPGIHGVKPPGSENEVKLSQFADDTTLLLTDEQSIAETFRVFDRYELASGAKINQSKCKGLWSGAFSRRTDQLHGFEWFKDGAYYCYCAYVLRISRYSDFLSVMLTNTGIFLRGLKLSRESRS